MAKLYTIEEIKTYITSQDSLGDALYNLNEDNVDKAVWEDKFQAIKEEIMDDSFDGNEDELMRETEELFKKRYKFDYYDKY